MDATTKGARTTYLLEVQREDNGVRLQMQLQRKQGRRTCWRCKEVRWSQIMDATSKGAARHTGWRCTGSVMGSVRSRMRLQKAQGLRTNWKWGGCAMESDHGCNCKVSRDDALAGGGERAQWSQTTDATAKGAETTHSLEVGREPDGIKLQMQSQREQGRRTN
jgi:hypothetical protein